MTTVDEVSVQAPNSVILVGNPQGELPASMHGALVAASPSVVAIGTLAEGEGSVRVRLAESPDDPAQRPQLAGFDGNVDLADKKFVVRSVLGDAYIERTVGSAKQRVRIWVDDPSEPRDIYILVGG